MSWWQHHTAGTKSAIATGGRKTMTGRARPLSTLAPAERGSWTLTGSAVATAARRRTCLAASRVGIRTADAITASA